MKKAIITQTIVNLDVAKIEEVRKKLDLGPRDNVLLSIFNKAMQDAGFNAMEYHNCVLTSLDLENK